MATQSYTATVEPEGILRLEEATVERLGLVPGDTVELDIRRDHDEPTAQAQSALLEIIGMFSGGHSDGAINHDRYLYAPDEA